MKKITVFFLLLIFILSGCNQPSSNENHPSVSTPPYPSSSSESNDISSSSSSESNDISSSFSYDFHDPAQTGDTVYLNFSSDEIVKIELLAVPQMNIESRETEDSIQIHELIQVLNGLVITDNNTVDYGKTSGLIDYFRLYFKNGDILKVGYTTGGIIIQDSDWKYGNRWLVAKGDRAGKINDLLHNLH